MAEKAPEPAAVEAAPPASGRKRLVTILIVLGVMGVEGVGVFALTRFLSPTPKVSLADHAGPDDPAKPDELPPDEHAEVPLVQCRLTNRQGVRTQAISISVSALTKAKNKEGLQKLVEGMKSRINDRVNVVVRAATDEVLDQPGLNTLKRQLKSEIDGILGDDRLVEEVLVGELIRSGG